MLAWTTIKINHTCLSLVWVAVKKTTILAVCSVIRWLWSAMVLNWPMCKSNTEFNILVPPMEFPRTNEELAKLEWRTLNELFLVTFTSVSAAHALSFYIILMNSSHLSCESIPYIRPLSRTSKVVHASAIVLRWCSFSHELFLCLEIIASQMHKDCSGRMVIMWCH